MRSSGSGFLEVIPARRAGEGSEIILVIITAQFGMPISEIRDVEVYARPVKKWNALKTVSDRLTRLISQRFMKG